MNMASQSVSSVYTGQMLWVLRSPRPYWPSIVCASDSGKITKNCPKAFVHVKCCANRESHWAQVDNVFEFNGYESYLVKKQQMKAILSDDEFEKAFGTTNNEDWRKAVIEAAFIFNKDVDLRLDAVNTLDEINIQLREIASNIHFDDATVQPSEHTRQPKQCFNHNLRRLSLPPQATEHRTTRRSLPASLPAEKTSNKKLSKFEKFEKALSEYQIKSLHTEKLFDGIRSVNLCKICCSIDEGNLVECSACGDHFHRACLTGNNNIDDSFVKLPGQLDFNDKKKRSMIRIRLETKKVVP